MQVWIDDRYVGDLSVAVSPGQRYIEMVSLDESTLPSPFVDAFVEMTAPAFMKAAYEIRQLGCTCVVDDFISSDTERQEIVRQTMRRYNVPADAKHQEGPDMRSGGTRHQWLWEGIRVTTAQAEQLFDHPQFEPV